MPPQGSYFYALFPNCMKQCCILRDPIQMEGTREVFLQKQRGLSKKGSLICIKRKKSVF